MLKKIVLLIIGVVMIIGCGDSQEPGAPPDAPMPENLSETGNIQDPVVVTVNGKEYKESDLMKKFKEMGGRIPPQQVMEQIIAEELLYSESVQTNNIASASEVQESIDGIIERFNGRENLDKQLERMNTTYEDFQNTMKRQACISKYLDQAIGDKVSISDASVEEYYNSNPQIFESVHASHILIKPEDQTEEKKAEAKAKIEGIAEEIKSGSDFAELAKTESACPSGIQAGGDLGTFPRGKMVPAFEDVAFSIEPGEVSDVVETQFGYHLIKVHEHETKTLDEVKEDLRKGLEEKEKQKYIQDIINELSEKATIEYAEQPSSPPMNPIK